MATPTIQALDGSQPHPSRGSWKRFLTRDCEVRDQADGVTYYGAANCNYLVFPDGTLVQSFGYHGPVMMRAVRKQGQAAVLAAVRGRYAELQSLLAEVRASRSA